MGKFTRAPGGYRLLNLGGVQITAAGVDVADVWAYVNDFKACVPVLVTGIKLTADEGTRCIWAYLVGKTDALITLEVDGARKITIGNDDKVKLVTV